MLVQNPPFSHVYIPWNFLDRWAWSLFDWNPPCFFDFDIVWNIFCLLRLEFVSYRPHQNHSFCVDFDIGWTFWPVSLEFIWLIAVRTLHFYFDKLQNFSTGDLGTRFIDTRSVSSIFFQFGRCEKFSPVSLESVWLIPGKKPFFRYYVAFLTGRLRIFLIDTWSRSSFFFRFWSFVDIMDGLTWKLFD